MAEQIQHGGKGGGEKITIWSLMSGIVSSRFFLYLYDYICMKPPEAVAISNSPKSIWSAGSAATPLSYSVHGSASAV